jgi:hypothetical protein
VDVLSVQPSDQTEEILLSKNLKVFMKKLFNPQKLFVTSDIFAKKAIIYPLLK